MGFRVKRRDKGPEAADDRRVTIRHLDGTETVVVVVEVRGIWVELEIQSAPENKISRGYGPPKPA